MSALQAHGGYCTGYSPPGFLQVCIQQRHMRHVRRVRIAAICGARLGGRLHNGRLRLDADEDALVEDGAMVHVLKLQAVGLHVTGL